MPGNLCNPQGAPNPAPCCPRADAAAALAIGGQLAASGNKPGGTVLVPAAGGTATQQAQQAQQAEQAIDASVRLHLEALAERLIAERTAVVLRQGQQAAEAQIRAGAVQAMAALTAPERGPAVIGTAAAVVAEVAAAAAEQRLRAHVPSALRRLAVEQLQHVLASMARGGAGGNKCGTRQASAATVSPQRPARLAEAPPRPAPRG